MKAFLTTLTLCASLVALASPNITVVDKTTLSDVYFNVSAKYYMEDNEGNYTKGTSTWKWYKPNEFPMVQTDLNKKPYDSIIVDFYRADHATTNNCLIPLKGDVTAKITLTQDQNKNLNCFIETS